ncbi:MAG: RDD family protein [Methanosarcinaceae archaeon]|nr:RDD family protein [Methanosarcinaceae archaeon]MDD4498002.1 RDD family protein [Methanosarcinaceae archaeon]
MEDYRDTKNSMFELNSFDYAGFWIRLGARLIDSIIVYILFMALAELVPWLSQGETLTEMMYFSAVNLLVGILYYAGLEGSSMQASIGKQVFKLKVIDKTGKQLSMPKALLRSVTKEIGIMFLVGGLMVGFTDKKRGLHDMVANTFVIRGR